MDHVYDKHESCTRDHCPICDGGLSVCTVCTGMEGSLTTHCPGTLMSWLMHGLVYKAGLDFYNGAWTWDEGPLNRGTFMMMGKPGSIDLLVEYAEGRLRERALRALSTCCEMPHEGATCLGETVATVVREDGAFYPAQACLERHGVTRVIRSVACSSFDEALAHARTVIPRTARAAKARRGSVTVAAALAVA